MIGHWPAKDYLHEDSKVTAVCIALHIELQWRLHMLLSNAHLCRGNTAKHVHEWYARHFSTSFV